MQRWLHRDTVALQDALAWMPANFTEIDLIGFHKQKGW
jgi:hypothetical protein